MAKTEKLQRQQGRWQQQGKGGWQGLLELVVTVAARVQGQNVRGA